MEGLTVRNKKPAPALPATEAALRARLAEVQVYLEGWRLIAPHSTAHLRALVAAGQFTEVEQARRQLADGASTERARLEIERCQLEMALADVDAAHAQAARRAVQQQLDAALLRRRDLNLAILALRDEEHRIARLGTQAATRQTQAAEDLEGWTDHLTGTTPEQRQRRRGFLGRYVGQWQPVKISGL
jgi:hypothetical protein